MSFIARLQRAREILQQQGRLSTRALERELGIGGDELDELIEELVDVQQVARREGRVLVWAAAAALPPPTPPGASPTAEEAVARKVVTIVFADLMGSTSLHERLDPESVNRVMDRYYRAVRAPVEAHGGTVVQLLGDGVMCAFGVPRVAEDDAIRAVRAAVDVQRGFREFAREESAVIGDVGLRVAVNTGEVVVSDLYTAGIGDPLNVAARLQQEARDGDVLLGEATQRVVRELVTLAPVGTFSLKGRAEPVTAYRVVSLDRPPGVAATAFVGRAEELARVTAVYEAAVAAPGARLAVILGSPGLGKSRLLAEFGRRLGDGATVLTARCDPAGGATFAPLAEALRAHLGIEGRDESLRPAIDAVVPGPEADRARIAGGIGGLLAGTPAPPEETFFVVRRFLGALAATRPVVLAIDDLQWAEPLLLDLVEHLVQWGSGVRLLVLAAARPDLRDLRSSLAQPGGLVGDVVTLAGLDAAAATRLAANVIGAEALPAAVAGRVLATSEGNPLFVGELVRMLVNDGALRQEGDRWTTAVELASLEMPPTIHALLAARIERLGVEERTVLERAAVIGRQFSRAAVAHLLPAELRVQLDARLEALRRSELIEPDTTWFLGEPALRFHHGLTRDAAYRRVLKGTRAELHVRVADWITSRVGEAIEHDETIGWHLEQAHQHLRELGPLDAQGRALGARAVRYLGAAGRRALGRDDLPVAANLLGRALGLLEAEDPRRAELALDWCEALLAAGDVGPAAEAIGELGRFLDTSGGDRLRAWHACFAGELAALTDPQALRATADAVAAAAQTLASLGDAAGEAKAHSVHALALGRLGRVGACEAALDLALTAARRAGDRRRSNTVLAGAPLAALWGPSPVTRASGRCLDVVRVLRITQGAPAVEATALRCQAVLEALRGRAEAARRMITSSRRMVEELGLTQGLLETEYFAGLIELIEGNAAAAERSLRAAYDGLRAHGLGIDAARAAALLGFALLAQRRAADAEALSHESEALAGDDLQAAITWRRVRAEALARRGEHAAAVDFARAAVEIAAATDGLLHHADARLALAAALRTAGRPADAAAEEARAIELWEAKGATVLAERARRGAGRAVPAADGAGAPVAAVVHVHRRIRPNAASAATMGLQAAFRARDLGAVEAFCGDPMETVDHPTGVTYGRDGTIESSRRMMRLPHLEFRLEVLATLGESLWLGRRLVTASGTAGGDFDVADYEMEHLAICELDDAGLCGHWETFAADHLGAAIGRFYERYAESLPDGPERIRAAATARSVAGFPGPASLDRIAAIMGPAVEFVDHRPLGLPPSRGRDAYLGSLRSFFDAVDHAANRFDDILALRADAYLLRIMNFGTERTGGGAFERPILLLAVFDADGLVTRWEFFAPDRDAEALARFDALVAEPLPARPAPAPSRTSRRRVGANAATAHAARLDAAIAARDADALASVLAGEGEGLDHTTGATTDSVGFLRSFRYLLRAEEPRCRHEPLATLGDSLALFRQRTSATGFAGGTFDVGAYERDDIHLIEVPAPGRYRNEIFAVDRLGDAVARLYERYAELLPGGAARELAAATARSVASLLEPADRWAFAPDVEAIDHRTVGFGRVLGAGAVVRVIRALLELMADHVARFEGILGLRSDALLVHFTHSGTDRSGGGAFERRLCQLFVFGADGLVTRWEQYDAEREEEALARFDELTAEPWRAEFPTVPARTATTRRVRPNAAIANAARFAAAIAARDAEAITAQVMEGGEVLDHAGLAFYDRQASVSSWLKVLTAEGGRYRMEPLATLGDSLAVHRQWVSGSGAAGRKFDVGAYEIARVMLIEVDGEGRRRWTEGFALDRLGDAIARLYERYAEGLPDGPARTRAAATARTVAALPLLGSPDIERYFAALSPDLAFGDRRIAGIGSAQGADAYVGWVRSLYEVAADIAARTDDVLALRSDALLVRWINSGTERVGGGAFERHLLMLWVFGADGLVTHFEQFDLEGEAEALARFDELAAGSAAPPPVRRRVRVNAATATAARMDAAIAARNVDAFLALWVEDCEVTEHNAGATYGLRGLETMWRSALRRAPDLTSRRDVIATLGDALALFRLRVHGSASAGKLDVGAYEIEHVVLNQVDPQGRCRRSETFGLDRLGDAVVRLYERYADLLPEGPERTRIAASARALATHLGPLELERFVSALAPAVEYVDHRRMIGFGVVHGAREFGDAIRTLFEVADSVANRVDDVLALCPDGALARVTNLGTERAGGGPYERQFLAFWVFRPDGLMAHVEQFDVGQEAEALARFDALTRAPAPARPVLRRVRPNAATASAARADAALAARDVDAFLATWTEDSEIIDHPTGTTYDRRGLGTTWHRALLRVADLTLRSEDLATLGDALGLFRQRVSGSASAGGKFDVGAYEIEQVFLNEVDAQGRCRHSERFAGDRLGDAVVRLYARYAELLPEGPERRRVAATARAVPTQLGPLEFERFVSAVAPAIEYVDHRRLIGAGPMHGAQAFREAFRALFEVAGDMTNRVDDVLGLRTDAALLRVTNLGTERVGGGSYERPLLVISVWADGLIARIEAFDPDCEAEALARFDALTAEPPTVRPARRRVRPNAATANAARIDAAVAARNAAALPALVDDGAEFVEHPTGAVYDREGVLQSLRSLLGAQDPALLHEPLAALGDRLALCRVAWSASGLAGGRFDVGAYEIAQFMVIEVGIGGRRLRHEAFALDRLGDAIVRLYDRYAERLPDGPARARAAATARGIAARMGPFELDCYAASFSPDVEAVDHRTLGTWSARGADALIGHFRSFLALVEGASVRADDVLGLRPDALLVRLMNSGTDRAGGGVYERPFLVVLVFGADGRTTRIEWFDVDREAEALARFDALGAAQPAAASPTPRIENAATRGFDRFREAWEGRDWARVAARFAPGFWTMDRRRLLRLDSGRVEQLESLRFLFEMRSSRLTAQVLATRGDRLSLARVRFEGSDGDVGQSEVEGLFVGEVDDHGDAVALVVLDVDDLDAAYAELDERYAAGEAAPYAGGWRENLRFWRAMAARDWRAMAATFAPGFVLEDRRPIGVLGSLSADEYVASVRALLDLRPDATLRLAHVLAIDDRRVLSVGRWAGGEPEGTFEIPVVNVVHLGPDGTRRWHFYNLDQLDAARACYEALAAGVPALRIENAATRNFGRFKEAWEARDFGRVTATLAPGLQTTDRRRMLRLDSGRVENVEGLRFLFEMRSSRMTGQVLATRGDGLALIRMRFEGSDDDVGASEIEALFVLEVDHHGDAIALVVLDLDDLDAAYAELDRCYYAGEGANYANGPLGRFQGTVAARDWEALACAFAPDFVIEDHRRGGLLKSLSREEYVASVRALLDLRPDAALRVQHILAADDRRSLTIAGWFGGEAEGSFEIPSVVLTSWGPDGIRRWYAYSVDQLDEARAQYDALGEGGRAGDTARDSLAALRPDPLQIPSNAATRVGERWAECIETQDWTALAALFAPAFVFEDRRRLIRTAGDRDMAIANAREVASMGARPSSMLLATLGDCLVLWRVRFIGGDAGSEYEIDTLQLGEVDAEGRFVAGIAFDPDDRRAASAELLDRYARSDAARDIPAAFFEGLRAYCAQDLTRIRAAMSDPFVVNDHRRTGVGRLERVDDHVAHAAALFELAPDAVREFLYVVAAEKHGILTMAHLFGTLAEGGEFEAVFVMLALFQGDRVVGVELFEPEDLDVARARFEALRPPQTQEVPTRPPDSRKTATSG